MDKIIWEQVNIPPPEVPKEKASARITKYSVSFNAPATKLIDNMVKYHWTVVRVGLIDNKPTALAFKFIKKYEAGALPVEFKKHIASVTSQELVKRFFKLSGLGIIALIQKVERVDDTTLVIQLPTEENLKEELGLDELERKLQIVDENLKL